jgi:helix-turn-helix protein
MSAGRPPDGWHHVDRLEGADAEKRRLKILLETLAGERSVEQACAELGVSASRFHEMRREALQAALDGLAPGPSGRPKHEDPQADLERLKTLERENQELLEELQASYVRTEIALAMPHVLTDEGRADIKKKARKARQRRRRGSGGAGSGT